MPVFSRLREMSIDPLSIEEMSGSLMPTGLLESRLKINW